MKPGDTFLGLDDRGHLGIVLIVSTADGSAVVANLTTHDQARKRFCSNDCVIVRPGEHPYPWHDSCVFYRNAFLTRQDLLQRGLDNGTYSLRDPLSEALLQRIREGALDSGLTDRAVKAAIRRSLGQS